MRSVAFVVVALSGCAGEPDPLDPGSFSRAAGTVRCTADEDGNLHVRAPPDARVTIPADARDGPDATAEIAYAPVDDGQMPRPIRPRSRSLGFIGDAPLTQVPSRGDRWSYGAHDDVLPPHAHGWRARW